MEEVEADWDCRPGDLSEEAVGERRRRRRRGEEQGQKEEVCREEEDEMEGVVEPGEAE